MFIPNPYANPAFAAHMAATLPFQPYFALPMVAASASAVRASLLAPAFAAVAWNIVWINMLTEAESGGEKPRTPA